MNRDAADVGEGDPRGLQRLVNYGQQPLKVGAGGNLRHHAAVALVQIGLRGDYVGQDARLFSKDRRGCFIAGSFQRQEVHG
jgi:hypothetical protein